GSERRPRARETGRAARELGFEPKLPSGADPNDARGRETRAEQLGTPLSTERIVRSGSPRRSRARETCRAARDTGFGSRPPSEAAHPDARGRGRRTEQLGRSVSNRSCRPEPLGTRPAAAGDGRSCSGRVVRLGLPFGAARHAFGVGAPRFGPTNTAVSERNW